MICDVRNVYPNNMVIDNTLYDERTFGFNFYGSYCIGADFYIYNANDMSLSLGKYSIARRGRYNGEELQLHPNQEFFQANHDYVWNARIIQSVDIDNNNYPSNLVTSGQVQSNPWISTTVQTFPTSYDNNFVPVETGLHVELPAYLYYNSTTTGYSGYKAIISYDSYTGMIKVNSSYNASSGIPASGESVVICKQTNANVPVGDALYVPLDTDNTQMPNGGDINYYRYYLTTNILDKSDTNYLYTYWLKINNQYRKIISYSRSTGICKITEKFTDSEGEEIDYIPKGTKYEIYSVAVWTSDFYFSTKANPAITTSLTYENELLHCVATITNQYYDIKYYQWEVYFVDEEEHTILIDTSQKIYNARLDYYCKTILTNGTYMAKCYVVTQGNKEMITDLTTVTLASAGTGATNLTATFNKTKNSVDLSWTGISGIKSYVILRKNNDTNEIRFLNTTILTTFSDYTCESEGDYTYYVTPKTESNVYTSASVNIEVSFDEACIYFLQEVESYKPSASVPSERDYYEMYGDRTYKVMKSFILPAEIDFGTIQNNLSASINNTYAKKPIATYGNSNYDSFSITFDLMKVNDDCELSGYDYNAFNAWREYINKQYPVIIKDMKGDVWYGSITSQSFKIQYDLPVYMPYVVTIDFTQTRDIKKTLING